MSDDDGEYYCRVLLASEGTHFVRKQKFSTELLRQAGGAALALQTGRKMRCCFQ